MTTPFATVVGDIETIEALLGKAMPKHLRFSQRRQMEKAAKVKQRTVQTAVRVRELRGEINADARKVSNAASPQISPLRRR